MPRPCHALGNAASNRTSNLPSKANIRDSISPRELEVIKLIAGGSNNREAAAKVFVGDETIKTHLLHVFEKLGVRDRAAAVSEAYKRHLIS